MAKVMSNGSSGPILRVVGLSLLSSFLYNHLIHGTADRRVNSAEILSTLFKTNIAVPSLLGALNQVGPKTLLVFFTRTET